MGEKDFIDGFSGLLLSGGKIVGFTKLTSAEFVDSEGEDICKDRPVFDFPGTQTACFQITGRTSRTGYYTFLIGPWPRMIRRAIRWEEKLRRKGVPAGERRFQAADKARWGGNNGKRKRAKVWGALVIGGGISNAAGHATAGFELTHSTMTPDKCRRPS